MYCPSSEITYNVLDFAYYSFMYVQILWTYHHSNHFAVYCVNLEHTRIDVLDSIDWSETERCSSFEERNFPSGHRAIERLSEAFRTVTGRDFQDFCKWPMWSKDVPRQQGNDCAIFTTKFLRHYDGEVGQLRCNINQVFFMNSLALG